MGAQEVEERLYVQDELEKVLSATLEAMRDEFARWFPDSSVYLVPYRGFGASEGTPRQSVSVAGQVADWHAAVEAAKECESAAEGKRERILRAAIKVFARKGFYSTRVSEIAKAAGVADGTIYLYFEGKDDLLLAVIVGVWLRENSGSLLSKTARPTQEL